MPAWRYVKNYTGDFFSYFFVPGVHNAHRPRILHRPWLLFFLSITLATEGFLVSNLIARQSDQQFLAAVVPAEIIALTNTERADSNVNNVTEDALLDSSSQAKAKDMAAKGYFSHVGPDGKTPWQWISASGYQYQYAGENLAVRFINSSDVVQAWMASPTHRANMVKPVYSQIGVGVAEGIYDGQPATYVVQYFGTPKTGTPVATVPSVATRNTRTTNVAAATPATPTVEGAATTNTPDPIAIPAPKSSFTQNIVRQLMRAFSEPQKTSNLLLGFIATLLIGALLVTFFTHVQVQHSNMLATGTAVAAIALFFLLLNTRLVGAPPANQSASVANGVLVHESGVVITPEAADTGYALFPN